MFYILAPNTEDIDAFQTIFRHEIEKIQKKLQTFTKVLRQLEVSFPYLLLMFCDSLVCGRILNIHSLFYYDIVIIFSNEKVFPFLGGGGCVVFFIYIFFFLLAALYS